MTTLLSVSVALLAGLLMTRVVKPLKLPDVTAYLVAGVLDLITHFVKEKVKIHTANKKAVKAENEKKQAEDARKQAEEAGKKLEEPKGEETV